MPENLPALSEVRPEVAAFARLMESKLRKHDDDYGPKGWKSWNIPDGLHRLKGETAELEAAFRAMNRAHFEVLEAEFGAIASAVANEAADVANFAMMIADMADGLDLSPTVPRSDFTGFQEAATELAVRAGWAWSDKTLLDFALGDKLAEEVGELARACRRHGADMVAELRPELDPTTTDQVIDEVGDVLFVLARRAALHGVDLGEAAGRVIGKLIRRIEATGKGESAHVGNQAD